MSRSISGAELRRLIVDGGAIHIWRISLRSAGAPAQEAADFALLSSAEQERASRFVRAEPRRQFTQTRAAMRRLLSLYLDCDPSGIPIALGEFAKPFLPAAADAWLQFNVSHTPGCALAAFRRDLRIGIDIEKVRDDLDWEPLVRQFFASSEQAELARTPPAGRLRAFFVCWTRKEAVIKASGRGLQISPETFAVPLTDPPATAIVDGRTWWLDDVAVPDGYVAAVATEGEGGVRARCFDYMPLAR